MSDQAFFPYFYRIHRADQPRLFGKFVQKGDHLLLIRHRDIQPLDAERENGLHRIAEPIRTHRKGHIARVHAELRKSRVVHPRRKGMLHGVAENSIYLCLAGNHHAVLPLPRSASTISLKLPTGTTFPLRARSTCSRLIPSRKRSSSSFRAFDGIISMLPSFLPFKACRTSLPVRRPATVTRGPKNLFFTVTCLTTAPLTSSNRFTISLSFRLNDTPVTTVAATGRIFAGSLVRAASRMNSAVMPTPFSIWGKSS